MKKILFFILFCILTINFAFSEQQTSDVLSEITQKGYTIISSNDCLVLAVDNKSYKKCVFYIENGKPKIIMKPKRYFAIDIFGNYSISDDRGKITIYYKNKKFKKMYFDDIKFSGDTMLLKDRGNYQIYYKDKPLQLPSYEEFILGEGIIFVKDKNNHKGIIKDNGEIILPVIYDEISTSDKYMIAQKGDSYAVLYNNKLITSEPLKDLQIEKDILIAKKNEKYGMFYFDKELLPFNCDEINVYYKYIIVKRNGKYGAFRGNEQILDIKYDNIEGMNSSLIVTQNTKREVYKIDKFITASSYDKIHNTSSSFMLAERNGKFKIIDSKLDFGDTYFDKVVTLGAAFATLKDKILNIYFINELVATIKCDDVDEMAGTYFLIRKGNKYGMFYKRDLIADIMYDSVTKQHNHFILTKNGKIGFVSDDKLIETKFDEVRIHHNYAAVRIGNKWGVYFLDEEKVPVIYDKVTIIKYNKVECTLGNTTKLIKL